jgi:hypothetical protein
MSAKPAKSTAPVPAPENLQGFSVDNSDLQRLREAVELAFDYRGDVTLTTIAGNSVEGYIFDRREELATGEMIIRIIPKESDDRITVRLSEVQSLAFTGKDTASGKTFENWIKKYAQKKLAGEAASIESEPLDEV